MPRYTDASFIDTLRSIHGNYYDYRWTHYMGCNSFISIICPVHGLYNQRARIHLQGHGCKRCSLATPSRRFRMLARRKHGNTYDYYSAIYTHIMNDVSIVCRLHGIFRMPAQYHLLGFGCPKCPAHLPN